MARILYPLALLLAAIAGFPSSAAAPEIPPDLFGRYAPAGNCAVLPRINVGAGGVFLDTATGRSGPLPIDMCFSCAGGAQYEGIQIWMGIKYGKDKWGGDNMPVIFVFNDGEKRGVLSVNHDDTLRTPLGAPMTQVVKAGAFRKCKG